MNVIRLSHLATRFQNLGEMMTLGRNDAAISPSFIEGLTLEGPFGHTGKFLFLAPFFSFAFSIFTCTHCNILCLCSEENSILD